MSKEIPKEEWEEAIAEVLQLPDLSPAQWQGLQENLAQRKIAAMREMSSPPAPTLVPTSTLASDLWACLMLIPRCIRCCGQVARWLIAEIAAISRNIRRASKDKLE